MFTEALTTMILGTLSLEAMLLISLMATESARSAVLICTQQQQQQQQQQQLLTAPTQQDRVLHTHPSLLPLGEVGAWVCCSWLGCNCSYVSRHVGFSKHLVLHTHRRELASGLVRDNCPSETTPTRFITLTLL